MDIYLYITFVLYLLHCFSFMLVSQYHSIPIENDGNCKKNSENNAIIALVVRIGFIFLMQNIISYLFF